MKIAFTLAYNGTHYLGSQTQSETSNTILGNVQKVFKQLGIDEKIVASGRTDKGVHATGQVCDVTLPTHWSDLKKLQRVVNEMFPSSIMMTKVIEVDENFHARYSAKRRVYRYLIKCSKRNPFEDDFITFLPNVDITTLSKNIKSFEGEHNFLGFMKTGSDVTSSVRVIYKAFAYKHKEYIVLNFEANGFLRSQIRLMVGALLQLNKTQIIEQLSCTGKHKIKPAPANGLYLAKIKY
ncbi:tRNA pseudouridine(38-40) synthase TruA [Sulfurimonas sp.]